MLGAPSKQPPPRAVPTLAPGFQRKLHQKLHRRDQGARRAGGRRARRAHAGRRDDRRAATSSASAAPSPARASSPSRPQFCLCRLDPARPATLTNTLLPTVEAAKRHEARRGPRPGARARSSTTCAARTPRRLAAASARPSATRCAPRGWCATKRRSTTRRRRVLERRGAGAAVGMMTRLIFESMQSTSLSSHTSLTCTHLPGGTRRAVDPRPRRRRARRRPSGRDRAPRRRAAVLRSASARPSTSAASRAASCAPTTSGPTRGPPPRARSSFGTAKRRRLRVPDGLSATSS